MSPVESLLRAHRAELVAFVRRRAGHLVDPEDVVQQASIKALKGSDSLEDPSRGRAWLFRIVRNCLVDELRGLGMPVEPPADDPGGPGEACRCGLTLARTLKPEYAEILQRVVLDEVPVSTLAAELGTTANNATVRLSRARAALRVLMKEHCGTTSLRSCLGCVCEERGCCAT